jgi:hypothetical protein
VVAQLRNNPLPAVFSLRTCGFSDVWRKRDGIPLKGCRYFHVALATQQFYADAFLVPKESVANRGIAHTQIFRGYVRYRRGAPRRPPRRARISKTGFLASASSLSFCAPQLYFRRHAHFPWQRHRRLRLTLFGRHGWQAGLYLQRSMYGGVPLALLIILSFRYNPHGSSRSQIGKRQSARSGQEPVRL